MRITYLLVFGVILASCSGTGGGTALVPPNQPNAGAPVMNGHAADHGYKQLYAFPGGSGNPALPTAPLLSVAGEFYGTTALGGSASCACGTVFKLSKSGRESVVYNFAGSPDGAAPIAGLVAMNGMLYGTTTEGGAGSGCNSPSGSCGTVFEVSPSGTEKVLYTFKGGADGGQPWGNLTVVNGELYGTTQSGGTAGYGTVFKISTSGTESVLHSFQNVPDGAYPYDGLIALHGALYGTTYAGGVGAGYGTVFKMSLSGKVRVIYNFNPSSSSGDGEAPTTGVVALNGKLYGTSQGGSAGNGTVFEVSMSGKERVLHSFAGGIDGTNPGGLVAVNGALYGPASNGGVSGGPCKNVPAGCGDIFKITASGKKTLLYGFQGTPDGEMPVGALIAANKSLYGTTEVGGAPGFGTVFKILP